MTLKPVTVDSTSVTDSRFWSRIACSVTTDTD
jgi:hypothetical protein